MMNYIEKISKAYERIRHMKIRPSSRAIPWFLVVMFIFFVIFTLIAGFLFYQRQQRQIKSEAQNYLAAIADLKVNQIVQWRHERVADGMLLLNNPPLIKAAEEYLRYPGRSERKQELFTVMNSFKLKAGYESSILLDAKGKVRLAVSPYGNTIGAQAQVQFEEVLKQRKVILSDLHISGPFPFAHMDLMIPLFSPNRIDSSLIGVIMLRIDPKANLFPLILSWPTPSKTSETLLFEQDGDSIVYLNELRHQKNTTLTLRLPISIEQLPASMAVRGIERVVEGIDYRGIPVFAALRHINDSPWYMNAKVDKEEIYEPLHTQAWNIITGMLLLILSAGSIVGFWWRNQHVKFYRERYADELERQALLKHFDYVIKYANDSVLLIDMNGKIVEANDQACRMYGYTREEIGHLHIQDLRSQEARFLVEKQMQQVEERGGLVFETEHRRKGGKVFPAEVSSRFIKIEGTKFYQSVIRDITERKQVEQVIRENEERFRKIFEEGPFGMVITALDYHFTKANAAFNKMVGYSEHEIISLTFRDITHPDDISSSIEGMRQLSQGEIPVYKTEKRYIRKDKEIVWGSTTVTLIRNEDGIFLYYLAMVEDITERKQAEEALHKSEAMLNESQHVAALGHYVLDVRTGFWTCSKALEEIFGINDKYNKNIEGWEHLLHPDYRDEMIKYLKEHVLLEKNPFNKEYKIIRVSDNAERWMHGLGNLEFDARGNSIKMFGTIQDITQSKRAEEALRISEERFRRLVGSVTDYIYSVKLESGRPVSTSHAPACVSVTGYSTEEYAADPELWLRMIHEDDKQIVKNHSEKLLSGFNVLPIEHRIIHKNGSIRWIRNTPVLKRNENGILIAYDGLIEDITMQKQGDEVLRESEETAHALLNASSEAAYLLDINRRIIAVNETGARRLKKSIIELIGICIDETLPHEMVESRKKFIDQVIGTCKPVHFKDIQSDIHLENSIYPIIDAQGKVTRIAVYSRDITESIRAEEAIQHERNLLRTLIDNIPDGIYVKDNACRKTIANAADVRNSGHHSEDEVLGKNDFDLYPRELAEKFSADDQSVLQTGKPILNRVEFVLDKEGKKRWLYTSKLALRNEKGKIIGLIGIGRDITQRMQAEEALRQSESLFKMLVESSPVAIAVFSGPSKKLEYVSDRFTELFGHNKEDISSMDAWWQLAYPVDEYRHQIETKWIENSVEAQRKGGIAEPLESLITCQDGSTKYIESTSTSIGEDTLIFFSDLTQHRLAQEALRQTHAFNELLIQTMPFGMDIVDEEGRILFMSKAMKDMLKTDAVDSCCWTAYKDDKQQCADCPLRKGITFGKPETIESTGIFNGKIFQISHVGLMYEGKKAILEVFQDITEQKKLQQDIMQSQKLLSIGTMAGGIAHDFNNILAIILGYSSLLHSIKDNPQKFADGVTAIRQAVDRGAGLVRQILTFARKTDISFEPLNAAELVEELVSMLQQTFPKIITFNTTIEEHIPYIKADHTQMHQALLNLCVNARDAMPQGGEISIAIKSVTGENLRGQFNSASNQWYVSISVSDNGMGMDDAIRSQIFDPFFTTKEKGKGTGLGLSVVYGIVQAHHGFVNVESTIEHGTTFTLYFPVPQGSSTAPKSQEQEIEQISGGNETLLLVEDETLLLDMVQILLETNGYTVLTAKDGEEAVQIYQEHVNEIALVISDMGLPKLTGVSEFEKMKGINPNVKVIFASGYFEPDVKAALDNAGVMSFIQKPYVIEEILSKIRKALDTK
jgi:two-component system, cell cycle sensor histidine kinase and response regulator CckA